MCSLVCARLRAPASTPTWNKEKQPRHSVGGAPTSHAAALVHAAVTQPLCRLESRGCQILVAWDWKVVTVTKPGVSI